MSRGLGKVERFVLAQLTDADRSEDIPALAARLAHDRDLARDGATCQNNHVCCDDWQPTPAEYESVRRAVHSLRRKGLVQMDDGARHATWMADSEADRQAVEALAALLTAQHVADEE